MLPFSGNYEWGGVGGLLVRSEVLQYVAALSGYFFKDVCMHIGVCVCSMCVVRAMCDCYYVCVYYLRACMSVSYCIIVLYYYITLYSIALCEVLRTYICIWICTIQIPF